MRNEKSYFKRLGHLTDLLLLLVNSIGIVGSLVQVLGIPWVFVSQEADSLSGSVTAEGAGNGGLDRILFWGGLFFICVSVIFLRSGGGKKKILRRWGICALLYIFPAVFFREKLLAGLSLALQNVVRNLNGRYLFHISLPVDAALLSGGSAVRLTTLSVLFFLYPLELLAGLFWSRGRTVYLFLGNILWLAVSFVCDVFPDFFFLTFCVLGITGALVQKEFEEMPGTGFLATACVLAITGCCVGIVRFILLPVLDERYLETEEDRAEIYRLVNEEWIPRLQSALPGAGYGFGGGPDVTGALNRRNIFSYTASGVYGVTVDSIPGRTLYLKGFVGGTYGEEEWEAWPDRQLEEYYEEHGLELPADFSALLNISYMAAGVLQQSAETGYIGIRELGGRGTYSIYPYGALLTEEFRVHGDGSVERRGKEYGFQYRFPEGVGGWNPLPEEWSVLEEDYRQYVYDNFLEYSGEDLPLLTERLEQEGFRRGNVYICLLEIMEFLSRHASYNLDVGRNPEDTDFVEYFLFDSHEGYCVHFASAAVLMLRYLGIPARYVTGYAVSPSDFSSDDGNTYTAVVTGKQAHAWAEIYLDAIGWVPVEMTPGAVALAEDNRLEQAAAISQLMGETILPDRNQAPQTEKEWQSGEEEQENGGPDTADRPESRDEPGVLENAEKPLQETEKEENTLTGGEGQEAAASGTVSAFGGKRGVLNGDILKVLLAFLTVLALIFTAFAMKRKRWRRMLEQAGTREEIFLLYRNLRTVLAAAGCSGRLKADGKGFWNFIRRNCPQITREEYENFCGILEKNSFGNEEPSEEELQRVRLLYERIVREVYGRMPVYRRLFIVTV